MSNNQNKGQPGRPPIEKEEVEEYILVNNDYIATDALALKLQEIITQFATYKLLTITGPNSKKNNEETKVRRKNVEKIQIKLREKLKIQEDYTFFLRDMDKLILDYDLINNELVDGNKYKINYEEFNNYKIDKSILHSIQLVNNQLNTGIQLFLIEFIKQYSRKKDNEDLFKEEFIIYILNNQDKFQEIINWSQLFDTAYDEKVELLKLEVCEFKVKYMPNEQINSKKYKVDIKREQQLKQNQSIIEKYENVKGENKSLKLFISDITETLKQFWQQDNVNNQ